MRYRTDKLASNMCLLSIVFNVIYFVCLYENNGINPDFPMGVDVICNILFMLFAFLASQKIKYYDKKWSLYTTIVGVIQILRIFWIPNHYLHTEMHLTQGQWTWLAVSLGLSAVCLFVSAVTCFVNSTALENYLKSEKEI